MGMLADKLHAVAFRSAMKAHAMLGLPAMTKREREAYLAALLAAPRAERLEIFEWGSGYSTVWTAKQLKARGVPFHIRSIDNHRGWHERVRAMLAKAGLADNVTLYIREFPPFWDKPGWDWAKTPACGAFAPAEGAETEYIELPTTLGIEFGLMLVDARFRRRCLEVAAKCVGPQGIVSLHDAQKSWYQEPTKAFAHSRFIHTGGFYPGDNRGWQMWFGSQENAAVERL